MHKCVVEPRNQKTKKKAVDSLAAAKECEEKILKLKSMSNCTEYTPNWSALTRMVFPQQDDPYN